MLNRNEWDVSYSTISFVERALETHSKVASFRRSQDIVFDIELTNGNAIKMLLVNEYTLGIAAINRALNEFPGIEYVVTCANWNGYTRKAKEFGCENNLGIFVISEFLGALNWTDPKKYYQKDENGKPVYYFRSA
jgi:hypothetical protein